jgi:serine/threonine-protein phosphatase 2B catalytic subunit
VQKVTFNVDHKTLGLTKLNVVAEMLLAILSICSEDELSTLGEESSSEGSTEVDSDDAETRKIAESVPSTAADVAQRRQQIRNKILAVGRMQRIFTLLRSVTAAFFLRTVIEYVFGREGSENVSELSLPTQTSALGVLSGPDVLGVHGNQDIRSFKEA